MAMTITEKILARGAGVESVKPGQLISAKIDLILSNDITAPIAIKEFKKIGVERLFDPRKVVFVPDHFVPNKDIESAEQAKLMRDFAEEQGAMHFEVGKMGVEHALLPEQGLVGPGMIIIGGDSHTCTYGALGAFATGAGSTDVAAAMASGETWFRVPPTMKFTYIGTPGPWVMGKDLVLATIGRIGVDGARYRAMEFEGPVIDGLSMDGRFSIANMAIEAGGKNGIFRVDDKTLAYTAAHHNRSVEVFESDPDAQYEAEIVMDCEGMPPQVAAPHLPSNVGPVRDFSTVAVDQVIIGSCTNGRIEDLRVAAAVLRGNKVHPRVRAIIIPATQQIYKQAMSEGLLDTFIDAGAAVSTPTCGPCLGGHMGVLARGERAVATTNRNFVGRMGDRESEVYLAGPAVAAASAVTGAITDPIEIARPLAEMVAGAGSE